MGDPLIRSLGKAEVVGRLNLTGEVIMVGDGFSDWLVKKLGAADKFWLFTENVTRQELVAKADRVVGSFEEVIKNLYS